MHPSSKPTTTKIRSLTQNIWVTRNLFFSSSQNFPIHIGFCMGCVKSRLILHGKKCIHHWSHREDQQQKLTIEATLEATPRRITQDLANWFDDDLGHLWNTFFNDNTLDEHTWPIQQTIGSARFLIEMVSAYWLYISSCRCKFIMLLSCGPAIASLKRPGPRHGWNLSRGEGK